MLCIGCCRASVVLLHLDSLALYQPLTPALAEPGAGTKSDGRATPPMVSGVPPEGAPLPLGEGELRKEFTLALLHTHHHCPVIAETETGLPQSDHISSSPSWTTAFQATGQVTEFTSEGIFAFAHSHKSFKEYAGNQSKLGRAVIPAAVLAGYTGEEDLE